MAKLIKKMFYTSTGDKKVNNYIVCISKSIAEQAGFNGDEQLKIYAKKDKIIIEKGE